MMLEKHFEESRHDAIESMKDLLKIEPFVERAVLIDDLFGRVRIGAWIRQDVERLKAAIEQAMQRAAPDFWTREIWIAPGNEKTDDLLVERAWKEGREETERLRILDRHRQLGSWLKEIDEPP